jgi:hypothetical protein
MRLLPPSSPASHRARRARAALVALTMIAGPAAAREAHAQAGADSAAARERSRAAARDGTLRDTTGRDGWNDSTTLALVRQAAARRRAQLADTALRDYRALARGTLTFLGQLGNLEIELPRVVQATQVATEVYWRAPNESKQRVVGLRDTTVLPTDNDFYRDRYGIVQNNFPDVIRIGGGRDVADVPHPLAAAGEALYDFAARDSLRIRVGERTVSVVEVQVRPRDPTQARLVGTLFVDRADAQVVRMAFTFTRPAYLDRRNEDVSIVLENALVQGRFWLPRRQEVEVRRAGTWLDFPARGIIRGRWDIGGYAVNQEIPPATFTGAELAFASPEELRRYPFQGTVLDAIPADVRMVSDEDVERVQAQARALVQAQVLARAKGSALSARAISDFVRVTRAEGLALGAGYLGRLGGGYALRAQARYGFSDEQAKGTLALERQWATGSAVRLAGYREYRDARDVAEGSVALNSLSAQEFGRDWTEPYDVRGVSVGGDLPRWRGVRPSLAVAYETQDAVEVAARASRGRHEPTIPATTLTALRLALGLERGTAPGPLGIDWGGAVRARAGTWAPGTHRGAGVGCDASRAGGCGRFARGSVDVDAQRAFGAARLVLRTTAAGVAGERSGPALCLRDEPICAVSGAIPPQELVYLGGPVTGPGYEVDAFAARFGVAQRVEWRAPVPFPSVSLGRYGRSPARATLAPFAHAVYVAQPADFRRPRAGWYPAVGAGAYVFFDLVRLDVARGVRDGRWTFAVDVARDFWRIL